MKCSKSKCENEVKQPYCNLCDDCLRNFVMWAKEEMLWDRKLEHQMKRVTFEEDGDRGWTTIFVPEGTKIIPKGSEKDGY